MTGLHEALQTAYVAMRLASELPGVAPMTAYGHVPPEYTCEPCFTPQDDGPCFDDLPSA